MTEIEKLLLDLIKIPSVSGQEKKIGNFLASQLYDFKVEKQYVAKNRFNVIARKGKSDIWIVVHMDTVIGEIPIRITKDKIYGRGAIDNKGNIAGAIMAARKMENINLLFTVGEEADLIGARKTKVRRGKFIVMEPTKMKIVGAQRGMVSFEVVSNGIEKHSSLRISKKENAVYNLISFINSLYRKNWTALNIIIMEGGKVDNIVPSYAMAKMSARPKNEKEYEEIIDFVERFKSKKIKIRMKGKIRPHKSSLARNGKAVPYLSEMVFFRDSILFGVGEISVAHSAFEHVLRKDLRVLPEKIIEVVKKIG